MADVSKPNVVFVLCDNVGWGDFGVYGGGTPTPRIDQLADEGIRFNNVRWPGKVPAGVVTEELLSLTTGTRPSQRWPAPPTKCPTDRPIDASTHRSSCSGKRRPAAGRATCSSVPTVR